MDAWEAEEALYLESVFEVFSRCERGWDFEVIPTPDKKINSTP